MPEKKRRPCDECNKSVTQKKKELADLDKLKAPKTKTLSVPSNKHAGVVGKRNAGVPAGSMLSQEYGKNSRGHSDREQAQRRAAATRRRRDKQHRHPVASDDLQGLEEGDP